MFGLILIYFLGKAFFDLAEKANKKKWLFAILGAASYYIGTFIGGAVVFLSGPITGFDVESANDYLLNILALPFGLLSCFGFYRLLKYQWTKPPPASGEELLDL